MENHPNKTYSSVCLIRIKLIFLIVGILFGFFGIMGWQYLLPTHLNFANYSGTLYQDIDINKIKEETSERLIKYVEGKWVSSIGDLIILIKNADENGEIHAMEVEISSKSMKKEGKYKILKFAEIDGFFGILKLDICKIGDVCSGENIVPIQINRVFGIDKTIVISYPSKFSGCLEEESDGTCSRSFKLTH